MMSVRVGPAGMRARPPLLSGAVLLALWLAGFAWFSLSTPDAPLLPADGRVDAVVVLTGGAGRIAAGLEVLKSGRARHMLVSGVDPDLPLSALRPAIPADEDLFRCCIDLGRVARNTEGNAAEAVAWARAHGHRSLAVVTAGWHMRRSLLEFARHPDAPRLYAIPVAGDAGLGRLFLEYNKYLFAALRRFAATPPAATDPE